MFKIFLTSSVFVYLISIASCLRAEEKSSHSGFIELGSLGFNWQEYSVNDNAFDPQEVRVVDESGGLGSVAMGYSFGQKLRKFTAQLNKQQGNIGYYGRIPVEGDENDYWENLDTDYDNSQLELSFGKYFDVDYIKPFAAILGGYSDRKRTINGNNTTIETVDEHMTYYYWGFLLDVEVFSLSNFSANIGGEFNRSFKTKQDFLAYDAEVNLKSLVSLKFLAAIHYQFLTTWKASVLFERTESEMDRSYPDPQLIVLQPRSEEHHSYLALRITKSF